MNPSGERCKYKETWVERQKEDGTGGDVCPATHTMTHEQKKRGGNNGTERIHGCGNPAAKPPKSSETVYKASLSNLHTHEATGSSPVVSTKSHRNRLIPVIFFHNPQLFWTLNFCRSFKTHTLTHTGKGAESAGQGQTGFFLTGPVFFCHIYRICWLMTPPMVSAASCFIWAVAWV